MTIRTIHRSTLICCPHCTRTGRADELEMHLKFHCPVLRPAWTKPDATIAELEAASKAWYL